MVIKSSNVIPFFVITVLHVFFLLTCLIIIYSYLPPYFNVCFVDLILSRIYINYYDFSFVFYHNKLFLQLLFTFE
jgi:hypothetical protein